MFRQGVAAIIINDENKVLLCKRAHYCKSNEPEHRWQTPQGGIDDGEDVEVAIRREVSEEIGIKSIEILKRSKGKTRYYLPDWITTKSFEGQEHVWFLIKFTGDDSEIDFETHPEQIEFCDYNWVDPKDVVENIIDFKKEVYKDIMKEFFNV